MNDIAKTIILPPGCVERLVDFSDLPEGERWFGAGVVMSAVCRHSEGYKIVYPHPGKSIVFYCLDGSYHFEYGKHKDLLRRGEFFVMPRGECQSFSVNEEAKAIFFLVSPSGTFPEVEFMHRPARNAEIILNLMELALSDVHSPNSGTEVRRRTALLILALVLRDLSTPVSIESVTDRLKAAIRRRPDRVWSVSEMASECGISASHLFAVCRKQCGCSPRDLLIRIREEYAKMLLEWTNYSVKTVAAQCGYPLEFSFSRAFSAWTGEAPTAFRLKKKK